jgi:hypothetical protein
MEDVLDVYKRPRHQDYPLVCLDETSKQLINDTRTPIPMKEGRPTRFDYEYQRNPRGQSLHDVRSARRLAACESH